MQKLNELMSKACLASELGKKGITFDLQMLSQVRDEVWAINRRAEAAEAKLAELEKQEPAIEVIVDGRATDDYMFNINKPLQNGIHELFTRPAPAADLAGIVPEKASMADYYENVRSGEIDPEEAGIAMWDACRAAILRNIEEDNKK